MRPFVSTFPSYVLWFFFSCYAARPDLHSFPTRRSSDLSRPRPGRAARDGPCQRALRDRLQRHDRSEEHTSELQSRRDLVCRLLLEKKKSHSKAQARSTPGSRYGLDTSRTSLSVRRSRAP